MNIGAVALYTVEETKAVFNKGALNSLSFEHSVYVCSLPHVGSGNILIDYPSSYFLCAASIRSTRAEYTKQAQTVLLHQCLKL